MRTTVSSIHLHGAVYTNNRTSPSRFSTGVPKQTTQDRTGRATLQLWPNEHEACQLYLRQRLDFHS